MGNFDAFVDEDDDAPIFPPPVFVPTQAAVPAPVPVPMYAPGPGQMLPHGAMPMYQPPVPVKPPPTVPTALGMVDLLASCRGKCTDQELHALKVTYMKLKERVCNVVDFLRAVRDVLGEDELVRAMAASRVARQQQAAAAALAAQAQAEALRAKELAAEAAGGDTNSGKDTAGGGKGGKDSKDGGKDKHPASHNLDVSKEADDVLAIAGVNADDEARYMFGGSGDYGTAERADLYTDFTPKASWRKLIELRVFARVAGEDGLAYRNGVPNVHEKVYEFVEEALQARLKGFIAATQHAASQRNDPNRNAFELVRVVEPKALVRKVNVDCEAAAAARNEKERQALLRVGETFAAKRRRATRGDEFDDQELKEKVAKVQAEEEDRVRAETANQAAQAALGSDAKYLKWAEQAKSGSAGAKSGKAPGAGVLHTLNSETTDGAGGANIGVASAEKFGIAPTTRMANTAHSVVLKDCAEAIKDDVRGKALRSRLLGKF